MIRVRIISLGSHDNRLLALIEDYTKRLKNDLQITWQLVDGRKADDRASETKLLSLALLPGMATILLDESGELVSSADIAESLSRLGQSGQPNVQFVIGGAYGYDLNAIRHDQIWSFGKITLPHQFVRLLLSEQLYRANCINKNHPYHHA